jgi:glycosyltransferase involved in cell wall biosynthesis
MNLQKNDVLVTVITVVYNGEKYLQQTIDSIRNQTYKNIEYIIIDGGSTDGTLDIIESNLDVVTKYISEQDRGLYDAMNKGISLANGELIGTINSDDWYELNTIEIVVDKYIQHKDKSIFHADRYDVLENGERRRFNFNPSEFKFIYYSMTFSHPTMFITKDEYSKHLYNINLKSHADYQFTLEAWLNDNSKFYYINKPLTNFRLGGISGNLSLLSELKEGYIARKYASLPAIKNIISYIFRLSVFSIYKIKNIFK